MSELYDLLHNAKKSVHWNVANMLPAQPLTMDSWMNVIDMVTHHEVRSDEEIVSFATTALSNERQIELMDSTKPGYVWPPTRVIHPENEALRNYLLIHQSPAVC